MTVKREFMEEALDSTGAAKVNTESFIISESQIIIIPDIHCKRLRALQLVQSN